MNITTNDIIFAILDALLMGFMVIAAVRDRKERIVKPIWQWCIFGLSIIHTVLMFVLVGWADGLICLITGIMMFAIHIVLFLKFKAGIGGVDVKVTSCLALYFGAWRMVVIIVVQSAAVLIYRTYMKVAKNKYVSSVPLMVPLSIATGAVLLISYLIRIL